MTRVTVCFAGPTGHEQWRDYLVELADPIAAGVAAIHAAEPARAAGRWLDVRPVRHDGRDYDCEIDWTREEFEA